MLFLNKKQFLIFLITHQDPASRTAIVPIVGADLRLQTFQKYVTSVPEPRILSLSALILWLATVVLYPIQLRTCMRADVWEYARWCMRICVLMYENMRANVWESVTCTHRFQNPSPVAVCLLPIVGGGFLTIRRADTQGKLAFPGTEHNQRIWDVVCGSQ